jgi:hypothetical protein
MFEAKHRDQTIYIDKGFERNIVVLTIFDDVYGIKIEIRASLFDGRILGEKRFLLPGGARKNGGDKKMKDDNYCEHLLSSLIKRALFNKKIKGDLAEILFQTKENIASYYKNVQEENNEWIEEKFSNYHNPQVLQQVV